MVGEALVVATMDGEIPWLIVAPTMRVPMKLRQSVNAYLAMKAVLLAARGHVLEPKIQTLAVPGFGTGVGGFNTETAARQMWQGFHDVEPGDSVYPGEFSDAQKDHVMLNPDEIKIWD